MEEKNYSRIKLLSKAGVGHICGLVDGALQGAIGSLAVPTSLRKINDNLDPNINAVFRGSDKVSVYDKLEHLASYSTLLPTRLGVHGAAMYKMGEDIINVANGGDPSYALLAIPNLVSLGYEACPSWTQAKNEWRKQK